ncbi:hypothetical protein D3C72_1232030 [compost metagenome]
MLLQQGAQPHAEAGLAQRFGGHVYRDRQRVPVIPAMTKEGGGRLQRGPFQFGQAAAAAQQRNHPHRRNQVTVAIAHPQQRFGADKVAVMQAELGLVVQRCIGVPQPVVQRGLDQCIHFAVALDGIVKEHHAGVDRVQGQGDGAERDGVVVLRGGRQLHHCAAEHRAEARPVIADHRGQPVGQRRQFGIRAEIGKACVQQQDCQRVVSELIDLHRAGRPRMQQGAAHGFGGVRVPQAAVIQRAIAQQQILQVAHLGHDQARVAAIFAVAPVALQTLVEGAQVG